MSAGHNADDGGVRVLSWNIDMSGFLHMLECDLRGGPDMSIGDMHGRADMRRFGSDLLAQSYLPALSVMRRDADLHQPDVYWLCVMSWHDDLSGHVNVRADPDLSSPIYLPGIPLQHDGRTVVSRLFHLPRVVYLC